MRDPYKLVQRVYDHQKQRYIAKYDAEIVYGPEALLLAIVALLNFAAVGLEGWNRVEIRSRGYRREWQVMPARMALPDTKEGE